jgi:hypothetical protein
MEIAHERGGADVAHRLARGLDVADELSHDCNIPVLSWPRGESKCEP